MIPEEWLAQAASRLKDRIEITPLLYDNKNDLYLKCENRQRTGSFKLRGALNKVLSLADWERQQGLVTASTGNHGQGVALAAREASGHVTVFASEHAVPAKLEAMRAFGAHIRLVAGGYTEAERAALAYAVESRSTWVSPYNDGHVIAGQGTIGLEIIEQSPPLGNCTWLVPVGGGGLIAGIAAAIRYSGQPVRLVGVQSEASPFMYNLFKRGSQCDVVEFTSLADGLAGMVEPGAITIPIVQQWVDGITLVTEEEIAQAVAYSWYHYGEQIEGSAAAALAAALTGRISARPAVIVLSGGNIQPKVHQHICQNWSRWLG
ncbi:MAG TPA: pyridoxal-phosphate dependent enzyme [Levilinea sp.]|nr:pyridoxal-phosphate dependent enzyme [Levilinea sp.]